MSSHTHDIIVIAGDVNAGFAPVRIPIPEGVCRNRCENCENPQNMPIRVEGVCRKRRDSRENSFDFGKRMILPASGSVIVEPSNSVLNEKLASLY